MDHKDHVKLIRAGIAVPDGVWADFGSGTGAFTLALAELLGPTGLIYSIDQDAGALREQHKAMQARFPQVQVRYIPADFTRRLDIQPLNGILMANSLHFIPPDRKAGLLQHIKAMLKPHGRLIIIEYNVDRGNPWVPYPFSFASWEGLAAQAGFSQTSLLAKHPSHFLKEFYSALSVF